MTLDEIPDGARVLLDANILIYHFTSSSEQCRSLLSRCQSGAVLGHCPAHVALEVLHRLMTLEARSPARRLAQSPDRVRALRDSPGSIDLMEKFGLRLLPLTVAATRRAPWFSLRHGLLANDAALLACMEEHSIDLLATADRQLAEVPPVKTYLVTDLDGILAGS